MIMIHIHIILHMWKKKCIKLMFFIFNKISIGGDFNGQIFKKSFFLKVSKITSATSDLLFIGIPLMI